MLDLDGRFAKSISFSLSHEGGNMGHCVEAFLAERANLEAIQMKYGLSEVVDLSHGFCLLPLLEELFDSIQELEDSNVVEDRFQFLTAKVSELLVANSGGKGIIYFETEYFGGEGGQGAVFVKDEKVEMCPNHEGDAINQALKLIGIKASGDWDEFHEVQLGSFRSNENWIKQPDYSGKSDFEEAVVTNGERRGIFASLWKFFCRRG